MVNIIRSSSLLLLSALVLSACQGQNPFNRQDNPVRDYPRVTRSIENKESTVPYGTKVPGAGATAYDCSRPMLITSNSPDGNDVFYFLEDSATSFEVAVQNTLGDKFELQALNIPDGAEFKMIQQESDSTAKYQLSWSPKNIPTSRPVITLQMRSAKLAERCKGQVGIDRLHLIVEKTKSKPTVSVVGMPKSVDFGQDFAFKVLVNDPQAKDEKPQLSAIVFEAPTGEDTDLVEIDGSKAADCSTDAKLREDGRYEFACKFLSSALQETDNEGLRGSGKSAMASFSVSARSRMIPTNLLKVSVKVAFKKVGPSKGSKK